MTNTNKSKIGVLVVHEWWGLNDYTRSRTKQLADLGYQALAVDMYGDGKTANNLQEAQAYMTAAMGEPEKLNARFQAAREMLTKTTERIYAIGYCFGGAVVLNQARRGTELAGVASFHGLLETAQPAQAGKVKARVLVATGGADPMVTPAHTAAFVAEMQSAEVNLQLLSFPGVKHGSTNPAATENGKKYILPLAYDAYADKTSWEALLGFLQ